MVMYSRKLWRASWCAALSQGASGSGEMDLLPDERGPRVKLLCPERTQTSCNGGGGEKPPPPFPVVFLRGKGIQDLLLQTEV